jgi:hypothetical protein
VHDGVRYQCPVDGCRKSYAKRQDSTRHIRAQHTDGKVGIWKDKHVNECTYLCVNICGRVESGCGLCMPLTRALRTQDSEDLVPIRYIPSHRRTPLIEGAVEAKAV